MAARVGDGDTKRARCASDRLAGGLLGAGLTGAVARRRDRVSPGNSIGTVVGRAAFRPLPAIGVRLYACLIVNLAERRAMWREHRHLRKFWRVRLVAALVAVVLSVWGGWFGGGDWMLPAALVLLFLMIFPFWFSDRRAEAEWKARRAARDAAKSRHA